MPMSQADYEATFGRAWHAGADVPSRMIYVTNGASPAGVLVPAFIGQFCFDTANEDFYMATGTANTDWKQVTA